MKGLRKTFLILGLITILLGGCAKQIKIECFKTPLPKCAAVVDEYKVSLAESQPVLRQPTPHELIELVECIELLEINKE